MACPSAMGGRLCHRTFAFLKHQTHWFFDCWDLCSFHGPPDDVVENTVALLSRCTSPRSQAIKAPCINCLATSICVRLAHFTSKSVCQLNVIVGAASRLSVVTTLLAIWLCRCQRWHATKPFLHNVRQPIYPISKRCFSNVLGRSQPKIL